MAENWAAGAACGIPVGLTTAQMIPAADGWLMTGARTTADMRAAPLAADTGTPSTAGSGRGLPARPARGGALSTRPSRAPPRGASRRILDPGRAVQPQGDLLHHLLGVEDAARHPVGRPYQLVALGVPRPRLLVCLRRRLPSTPLVPPCWRARCH